MKFTTTKQSVYYRQIVVLVALLLTVAGPLIYLKARADHLSLRELKLSTTDASATSSYVVSFTNITSGTLGSVQVQFCSNDPYPGLPCTAPTGLSVLTATLSGQSGVSGYSIDPSSTANNLILSGAPTNVGPVPINFTLDGVTNPSDQGTYYVRLQTFASNDASGTAIDNGGLAFAIGVNSISINAEVPPYLLFCSGIKINDIYCNSVTGNYVDFGNLLDTSASSATTELLVTTNGKSGYSITMGGNTMISGNNAITSLVANDVSRPGVNQFGLNLRANTTPAVGSDPSGPGTGQPSLAYNIPNQYRFNSGEIIASNSLPEDTRLYTVSYLLNISVSQPIGIYSTTISYITLANF